MIFASLLDILLGKIDKSSSNFLNYFKIDLEIPFKNRFFSFTSTENLHYLSELCIWRIIIFLTCSYHIEDENDELPRYFATLTFWVCLNLTDNVSYIRYLAIFKINVNCIYQVELFFMKSSGCRFLFCSWNFE